MPAWVILPPSCQVTTVSQRPLRWLPLLPREVCGLSENMMGQRARAADPGSQSPTSEARMEPTITPSAISEGTARFLKYPTSEIERRANQNSKIASMPIVH